MANSRRGTVSRRSTFAVTPEAGAPSAGASGYVEQALEAVEHADDILSELQDSMLPVEVGDPELRTALAEVRTRLGELPGRTAELLRRSGASRAAGARFTAPCGRQAADGIGEPAGHAPRRHTHRAFANGFHTGLRDIVLGHW